MARPDDTLLKLGATLTYSQCWEDIDCLLRYGAVAQDQEVLAVASAGDNVFALALAGARHIDAFDISLAQLALVELKLAATELEHADYLKFLGLAPSPHRLDMYQQVRGRLSPSGRRYWDSQHAGVQRGLAHCGRMEAAMRVARRWLLPLLHTPRARDRLLTCGESGAAEAYETAWNNRRWRGALAAMLSPWAMRRIATAAAQAPELERAQSRQARAQIHAKLAATPWRDNPYMQWLLLGRYLEADRAFAYLRADRYADLRACASRITLRHSSLETLLATQRESYGLFYYSNLLDYVGAPQEKHLWQETLRAARPGATYVSWSFLTPRPLFAPPALRPNKAVADAALAQERTCVYGALHVGTLHA